jgi:hypothetical protein
MNMDPRLADGDWAKVFEYCGIEEPTGEDYYRCDGTPRLSGVLGYEGSIKHFTRADVAEIIGMADGANDGPNWIGAFRLKDGRFAFVSAGCDYTGWD